MMPPTNPIDHAIVPPPPSGYVRIGIGDRREPGYVFWDGAWLFGAPPLFWSTVDEASSPCANPVPHVS